MWRVDIGLRLTTFGMQYTLISLGVSMWLIHRQLQPLRHMLDKLRLPHARFVHEARATRLILNLSVSKDIAQVLAQYERLASINQGLILDKVQEARDLLLKQLG